MPNLFTAGKFKEVDNNGNPAEGYLVYVFLAGTTTKTTTYQEFSQDTPNTNPIILDSRGEANIWLPSNQAYKVTFTTPDDNLPLNDPYPTSDGIWTQDFIQGGVQFASSTVTGNITLTVNDNNKVLLADASSSNIIITPPTAATAGSAFIVYVIRIDNSVNTVTFDPPGAGTVDGQLTFPFTSQYQSASFVSSGSAYYTLNNTNPIQLLDTNNNTALSTTAVTNPAANNYTILAAAGGSSPTLQTTGTDTNIRAKIKGKGNRGLIVTNGSDTTLLQVDDSGTSINSPTAINGVLTATSSDARTNTVAYPEIVYGSTSGTAAANIGTGTKYQAKSADETPSDIGAIQFANSDITAGSEDTYFSVLIRRAGAAISEAFRWAATSTFKTTLTHSNTADRTITYPDANVNKWLIQEIIGSSASVASTTTTIPADDTIPQIGEGAAFLSAAITPSLTTSTLEILVYFNAHLNSQSYGILSLFQDATANALSTTYMLQGDDAPTAISTSLVLHHRMTSGTTSSTTFSVRGGPGTGAVTFTMNGAAGARLFGGTMISKIIIREWI